MTDQHQLLVTDNTLPVQVIVTIGTGSNARLFNVDFDLLFPEGNPDTVTDRQLTEAVERHLEDELVARNMGRSLPRNYIVNRATRSDGMPSFIVGPKPEFG